MTRVISQKNGKNHTAVKISELIYIKFAGYYYTFSAIKSVLNKEKQIWADFHTAHYVSKSCSSLQNFLFCLFFTIIIPSYFSRAVYFLSFILLLLYSFRPSSLHLFSFVSSLPKNRCCSHYGQQHFPSSQFTAIFYKMFRAGLINITFLLHLFLFT